ncbi:unnamed protein product [Ilex paraguariensis]|uniref:C2 NT-type domain-containing protein n=1 Tax=Ilex paraguariensis TaxID=185542 RepID=A0ABC8S6Y4_9AQUA
MVVKMMRWRPWPPLLSKKFEVKLIVRRLEGLDSDFLHEGMEKDRGLAVEIRWKGSKIALSSFGRTVKRNFTREENPRVFGSNGVVEWEEEFQTVCNLSGYKDNVFHPWEIGFSVLNGLNPGPKNKVPVVGTALLNLAEFTSAAAEKEFELNIPLAVSGNAAEPCPSLCISLGLLGLRTAGEPIEAVQRSIAKAGLRKVKIFTKYVSARRAKKACHEEEGSDGRCSSRSEDGNFTYPFDSDSVDEFEESDESKEDSNVTKSFSYGPLAFANCAGQQFHCSMRINGEDDDWIYYSHCKSDVGCSHMEDLTASISEPSLSRNVKRSILPWRKRKLSFRSPKTKGEPLLKKVYGEEGGDDIDFDRRQLSSDESLFSDCHKTEEDSSANLSSLSEFGDDNFAIGSWEQKDITSRDGYMKLQTQVFFASIDQRSEQAAGESACTVLVAVITDWLQNNNDLMPIKSQFDSLIREGSLEWRKFCENETYRERFPDKHFDLETVLQASIRSLAVISRKSFIGFFHPDGMEEGRFDFLHGAMSFDSIWDEISRAGSECPTKGEPQVYIISWNDHFFVLKVEQEAYYIIDTLGERLYEGCYQAYILKFDRNTTIFKLPSATQSYKENTASGQQIVAAAVEPKYQKSQQINPEEGAIGGLTVIGPEESMKSEMEEEVVCRGKESCKEYIKSFLAAIPIRELQADLKKGLVSSTPVHHRLQIEFHFTHLRHPAPKTPAIEVSTGTPVPQVVEVALMEDVA